MVNRPGCSASGCVKVALVVFMAPFILGLGLWFLSNLNRVLTHDTITGVVVDLERSDSGSDSYRAIYEYEVDGVTYTHRPSASYGGSWTKELGDTRPILYDPGNPDDSAIRNLFLLVLLPGFLLAIPVLIVVGVFWFMRPRTVAASAPDPLTEQPAGASSSEPPIPPPVWPATRPVRPPSPQPSSPPPPPSSPFMVIEALFMGTEHSQMDQRGRIRYRVSAKAEIEGQTHRFHSEWLDKDPTLYYMQHGNKVEVRIDRRDPSQYTVIPPEV